MDTFNKCCKICPEIKSVVAIIKSVAPEKFIICGMQIMVDLDLKVDPKLARTILDLNGSCHFNEEDDQKRFDELFDKIKMKLSEYAVPALDAPLTNNEIEKMVIQAFTEHADELFK